MTSELLVVLAAIGSFLGAVVIWTIYKRRRATVVPPSVQHDFNKVFMFTMPQAKEDIIADMQKKFGCSRSEAMKRAVSKWRQENRVWK